MRYLFAAAALALLAACAHTSQSNANTAQEPQAAPTDPIADIPLYEGSTVIAARDWRQTVDRSTARRSGLFDQGAGTYGGHEVVAESEVSMPQLSQWVESLDQHPPAGLRLPLDASDLDGARARLRPYGIDFGAFERDDKNARRGVVVLAIDPQTLETKAGVVIDVLGKYRLLPAGLRAPLDAQMRAQTGFSVSDALDPATPIGAAIGALAELRSTGQRGIVVLDAQKQ